MKTVETRVYEHCKALGIDWVVLDWDDFASYTHRKFKEKERLAMATLSESLPNVTEEELRTSLRQFSLEGLRTSGTAVRKDRWREFVFPKFQQRYKLSDAQISKPVEHYSRVYQEKLKTRKGFVNLVRTLRESKVNVAIGSHADPIWALWKALVVGITPDYVKVRHVIASDHNQPNKDWTYILARLNTYPQKVVIAGDNIKSDVQQAHDIGVERLIWFNGPECPPYGQTGDLPLGTKRITNLSHFIPALLSF